LVKEDLNTDRKGLADRLDDESNTDDLKEKLKYFDE